MTEITDFLMKNYFAKYNGTRTDIVPTVQQLEDGYKTHKDKFVIIKDDKIKGIAIFLTLTDETYKQLKELDITRVDILKMLLKESGQNVHFVLLCAGGIRTILAVGNEVKRRVKPKTVSWWNPSFTKLHQFQVGGK